jgi:hypothetical protein
MAETLNVKGFKIHQFPNKKVYQQALRQGLIKEGEMSIVDGEEQFDSVPTKGSENLVKSGAIFDAVEEVATVPMTTSEVIELWNKIMNEGAV